MSGASFVRLREIFNDLIELDPAQRRGHVAALSGIDDDTRRQLLDLLAADDRLDGATARAAVKPRTVPPADWIGRRIGPFVIREQIGRGGMASVFLADRVEGGVAQQVAVKIIRPELVDDALLARFRLERQLLALLKHPNIPTLLDLGEIDERTPYVVMEHVVGVPIDHYVREHALDVNQCLRLFLPVCDAVAFAHRNLIVHRDLKPGNVLVDAAGSPQLLDFGIAKPLQAQVGAFDVAETSAAQRFLSLSHAAPEQVSGAPITTACDVYGLGALLYELLAGTPPLLRDGMTRSELEQDILQRDPPPPSRLARVGRAIPYDLDLIVLRCLRKPPAERYASVEQLADDIRRLLDGRPVHARRGNLVYRAQRFVARNAVAMIVALIAVAVLAGGTALLWRQQLATARQQLRADEMTGLIMDALASVDANSAGGKDLTARDMFQRVAAQARTNTQLSAASRGRVLTAIAHIELGLGYPAQTDALLKEIPEADLDEATQRDLNLLKARLYLSTNRHSEASELITRELARERDPEMLNSWKLRQIKLTILEGKYDDAMKLLDAIQPDTLSTAHKEQYLLSRSDALRLLERVPEATADITEVLAAQRARLGQNSPATFLTLRRLALLQLTGGKTQDAAATFEQLKTLTGQTFSTNSAQYADALYVGTELEIARGNLAKAIAYEKESLDIQVVQFGEKSSHVATRHHNLADLYEKSNDPAGAEPHFRKSTELAGQVFNSEHPNRMIFRTVAALFFATRDQCDDARPLTQQVLADQALHPRLKQYDVGALALTLDVYCACQQAPGPDTRAALARSLEELRKAAASKDVEDALARLVEKAKALGVVPASS